MNFLCPSCRTPLPRDGGEQVTCTGCGVAVDLARVETAPGQARLWPEVDLSGEALGGYALVKLIGSGGMGTVYEARTPEGTTVALKVLAPLLAAEPALRERFRREARALAAIKHPGVVQMLGEGEERSFCWYAMEHVEGVDLRKRLERGPLPVNEVVALARAVLDALVAVHAAGFVHRDVKPSNLLLAPGGPKLCDFGIARLDGANTLTESAAVLGSLRYMAPEQRWGKCDERSDLYALGVVLHEALALGVPGEKTLPPGTPVSLARLIERLTESAPSRRPESAVAARRLLNRVGTRDVRFAAAAILAVGVLGAGVAVSLIDLPLSAGVDGALAVDSVPRDAGALGVGAGLSRDALLAEALDAGAGLSRDALLADALDAGALGAGAGLSRDALAVALDAGARDVVAVDARLPRERLAALDAGVPRDEVDAGVDLLATVKGVKGTKGIKGDELAIDGLAEILASGPKGAPPKPTAKPAPIKKPVTKVLKAKEEPSMGRVVLQGMSALVSIRGLSRGWAPGAFNADFGTFPVQVTCVTRLVKSKKPSPPGKTFDFEVTLSPESPTRTLTYDCT